MSYRVKVHVVFSSTRMKTIVNTFFIVIAFLFGVFDSVSKNNPPPPNPNGKINAPPPPDGFPIDENLPFLILIALLFGMYVIYNQTLKTKNQH